MNAVLRTLSAHFPEKSLFWPHAVFAHPHSAQAAMAKKSNPLDELNASAKHFTGDVKSRTRSGAVAKRAFVEFFIPHHT